MAFEQYLAETEPSDIVRYVEYKAAQEGITANEAASRSLARLFGQVQDSPNILVILTAFRSERTLAENKKLNRELAQDLRSLGWGYTPVLGGYLEKVGEKEVRAHEESYFVNAQGDERQVFPKVLALLKKYGQESALVKPPGSEEASLLFPNGSLSSVGKWHADPTLMATYYTRMRKGVPGRQFKFEAAGDDSRTTRMAVDAWLRAKK